MPIAAQAIEWPVFKPFNIEALIHYDQWSRQTDQTNSDEYDLRLGFGIEGDGYWMHPGIVNFFYYLEPTYITSNFTDTSRQTGQKSKDDWSGHALNYSLNLDLLGGTTLPVYATLATRQSLTNNQGSFGRRTETDLKQNSLLLGWKNPYFPLTFKFDMRDNYTVSDPGLDRPKFIRDDLEHIFSIAGKSSKTDLELQYRSMDDRVISRNNDFEQSLANLRHTLPWGTGSTLVSRLHYRNRTGFNPVERFQVDEIARIKHGEYYDSETRYQYNSTTQNITSTTHTGSFRLRHQYYLNLTSVGTLRAEDRRTDDAHKTQEEIGLKFAYQKSDFFGAAINAHIAAEYSINDLDSNAGFHEVFEQPHTVRLTGGVILDDRFIAAETIIVTDATSTIVFSEGIDYEVVQVSNNLTQLFIIPGGQIISGDTILVSYKAVIIPSVEYSALNSTTGFSYRKGWFSLNHYNTKLDYNTISGNGDFLTERRDTTTRMDIQWDMGPTSNQFTAERRYYKNGVFETTTYSLTQALSVSLSPRLMMNLSLTGSQSESELEDTELYLLNLNFLWRPSPYWTIRPVLGVWQRDRTNIPGTASGIENERILSASLNIRWLFRKINLDLNLRHNDRVADDATFVDDNINLNIRRRF
ncbi:MAG: hypothetical protein IMF09_08940 [Proteobacteria bacterium]|nr:hypothetical protein [Pseudomonadota bacterium]